MVGGRSSDRRLAERRWTRGAWLTVCMAALFSLCQLAILAFSVGHPTDGCLISQTTGDAQLVRACIGDWPTPLRPGDALVQVDGRKLSLDATSAIPPSPPRDWVVGATVPYTVRRDGAEVIFGVSLHHLGWGEIARLFAADAPTQATNAFVILVTVVAFSLRPSSPATRLLLVGLGLSVVVQMVAVPSSLISEAAWSYWPSPTIGSVAILLGACAGWLGLPATLLLLLSFPRRLWPLSRWPRAVTVLVFGVGGAASLLIVLTDSALPFLVTTGAYAVLVIVTLFGAIVSARLRVRDPVVRAQVGWMGLGFAALTAQISLWLAGLIAPSFAAWLDGNAILQTVVVQLANLALPLSLAIAITRYRLFDVDVIVNRALVYGTLTALLAVAYFGGVAALQQVLSPVFGPRSGVAVAASTLAIAALFQPLRVRIQAAIDRRFFRQKYDAARVLVGFGAHLRDEVDLDALCGNLLAVVAETLHPAQVTLRLRDGDQVAGDGWVESAVSLVRGP